MEPSLATTSAIRNLDTEMLARFRYPESLRTKVEVMMKRWEAFCALPDEVKMRFGYVRDKLLSGAGYELKRDPNSAFDLKEDFHVRRDHKEFLLKEAANVGSPEALGFLEAAFAVYPELDELALTFVTEVEEAYGIKDFVTDSQLWRERCIIRLLHYFAGAKPGDVIGDPHPDKGGYTGHLYESDSGVERLTPEGTWVPMDVEDGGTLFFAGVGLQHRSRCAIKAVWHRIIANERTAKTGRYSAVCFSSSANGRYYDKDRVGRTQDLPLGASYTQSFEEFDTLFKDP